MRRAMDDLRWHSDTHPCSTEEVVTLTTSAKLMERLVRVRPSEHQSSRSRGVLEMNKGSFRTNSDPHDTWKASYDTSDEPGAT